MLHEEHGTAEAQGDRQRAGMSKRPHDGYNECILVVVLSCSCVVVYGGAGNLLIDVLRGMSVPHQLPFHLNIERS